MYLEEMVVKAELSWNDVGTIRTDIEPLPAAHSASCSQHLQNVANGRTEEPSAENLHAWLCGSRGRATAHGHPRTPLVYFENWII